MSDFDPERNNSHHHDLRYGPNRDSSVAWIGGAIFVVVVVLVALGIGRDDSETVAAVLQEAKEKAVKCVPEKGSHVTAYTNCAYTELRKLWDKAIEDNPDHIVIVTPIVGRYDNTYLLSLQKR